MSWTIFCSILIVKVIGEKIPRREFHNTNQIELLSLDFGSVLYQDKYLMHALNQLVQIRGMSIFRPEVMEMGTLGSVT